MSNKRILSDRNQEFLEEFAHQACERKSAAYHIPFKIVGVGFIPTRKSFLILDWNVLLRYALCFPFPLFSTDSFLKPRETKVLKASSGGKSATRSPSLIAVSRVAPRPFTIIIFILS